MLKWRMRRLITVVTIQMSLEAVEIQLLVSKHVTATPCNPGWQVSAVLWKHFGRSLSVVDV
jgi:hypothetical protein